MRYVIVFSQVLTAYVRRIHSIVIRDSGKKNTYSVDRECKVSVAMNGRLLFRFATSITFASMCCRCDVYAAVAYNKRRIRGKENETNIEQMSFCP